jgi:DNA invertase Pin-like site-specific DNA recombinase
MKTIAYIRVSTIGQVEDGVSLDAQAAKIAAWADLNGYEMGDVFSDAGISGSKTNRPGLSAALDAVGKGDALVVYSLSRLARNTSHTLEIANELEKKGADLVSLSERIDTTTAAGKMVFRMLAVLSEFERDQVSERTSLAMSHKKAQGQRVGSIPYGKRLSRDGITLENDEAEQKVISLVRSLRHQGISYPQIATELDRLGFKPKGKAWHPQTIKNISLAA